MKKYDHQEIEKKWRQEWEKSGIYNTPDSVEGRENLYTMVEFPYPSGDLHVGHWYAFAVPDMYARAKRMQGYNVLYPIGFDSFGLPAENAAIKHGVNPREWTESNMQKMVGQLESMGAMFDWSRKLAASDPEYYKWTQWLFLELYRKNLAYRGEAEVNWDPVDQTVLANEQVQADGTAERSGAVVEKKMLKQWFLKITDYADRLLEDLDELSWSEEIKQAQRAWIGKSEGANLKFKIRSSTSEINSKSQTQNPEEEIEVFTTRPDTLFGVTYLVLAPEHSLVQEQIRNPKSEIQNKSEVEKYINDAKKKSELERSKQEKDKTGVKLEGVKAVNPANGEEIPIFVADYVLGGYGTGAIMAVPAHDERDFEFAKKHDLSIKTVVEPQHLSTSSSPFAKGEVPDRAMGDDSNSEQCAYTDHGVLINSGKFDGMNSEEAKSAITESVGGRMTATYRLRDWLVSRQRYWGCPIPIVYDPEGAPHPVPKEHLPWTLPEDVDFKPTGEAPLARSKELKDRVEKIFGEGWTPEVDTLDTFVDSSWYFLRYTDPHNNQEFANQDKLQKWMPINRYSGGAEHTTMHVLYSRFFHKALFDLGLVNEKEPYVERFNRGLIVDPEGKKMSKRWGNFVNPDDHVESVGADAVRMYLAFIGPYNETGSYPWDTGGLVGVRRFLDRVYNLSDKLTEETDNTTECELHRTVKKVGEDLESFKTNTAVSAMMVLINVAEKEGINTEQYETFLCILAPFAPFMTEELWKMMGHKTSIHLEKWPEWEQSKIEKSEVNIVVQIDGKVRASFTTEPGAADDEAIKRAKELPEAQKWLEGKAIKKEIYVPNKLVSISTDK